MAVATTHARPVVAVEAAAAVYLAMPVGLEQKSTAVVSVPMGTTTMEATNSASLVDISVSRAITHPSARPVTVLLEMTLIWPLVPV